MSRAGISTLRSSRGPLALIARVAVIAAVIAGGAPSRAGTVEAPPEFDLPRPSGKRWRPGPTLPPFGYVNTFYGGCRSTQPCGSLVAIASFKKGRIRLRAFRTADGRPPVAPRDASGSTSMAPSPNGAAPIYELERGGVTFAWATVAPFVLEAEGPTGTAPQERALRRAFRSWVDQVDDQSPPDEAAPAPPSPVPERPAEARETRDPSPEALSAD
ncbi:MAG TPA: hypothetical protein VIU64_10000 [Polyangia bacterium]